MEIKTKFSLDENNPHVRQFPLVIRERVYNEVKGLLDEVDEYFEDHDQAIGIQSEEWPVTYMFCEGDGRVIVVLTVYNENMERDSVLTFNFNRNEMDKLLEE